MERIQFWYIKLNYLKKMLIIMILSLILSIFFEYRFDKETIIFFDISNDGVYIMFRCVAAFTIPMFLLNKFYLKCE